MKKNNIFLLSYICFIFISLVVHLFVDYPMWTVIVVATTTASCFFAISDYFYSYYKISNKFSKKVLDGLEQTNSEIDNIKIKIKELIDNKNFTKGTAEDYTQNLKDLDEIKENSQTLKQKAKKLQEKSRVYKQASCITTFIGFLLFFSILVFDLFREVFTKAQDALTVGAFLLILLIPYTIDPFEEAIQDVDERHNKSYIKLKKIYNYYV